MRRLSKFLILVCLTLTALPALAAPGKGDGIKWEPWADNVFEKSADTKKLVILNLEAVWCHWCHVMEEKTYSNAEVIKLIGENYIATKVDQDSRPDLSNRYKDYGWPATIFFSPSGQELAKRAGYIAPDDMVALLKRLAANPVPEEESKSDSEMVYANEASLSDDLRKDLTDRHYKSYDSTVGGLKLPQKYLEAESVEWSIELARQGSERDREMATKTLRSNMKLVDPVWGGVYQYSTHHDWDHPHFEKIMQTQANNVRLYSLGYSHFKEDQFLDVANRIRAYVKNFLTSPDGTFYTSQDADVVKGEHSAEYFSLNDAERRKAGMPAIDKHVYSRENGWIINALGVLYSVKPDQAVLDEATRAAEWIVTNRALPNGGFRHDEKDIAGPYLGDTLEMGRAFMSLYTATGDRKWLTRAEEAMKFIAGNFRKEGTPGFFTSALKPGLALEPVRLLIENVNAARFALLLSHHLGNEEYRKLAEEAMRFAGTEDIALDTLTEAGVLIADAELSRDPLHICVVGGKSDPVARELFLSGLSYPTVYKRLEWWDRAEGPMPNPDVQYPKLEKAAAFVCTNKRCSLPIFKPADIAKTVDLFEKSNRKKS